MLYVPGINDINEIQTVASLVILESVARLDMLRENEDGGARVLSPDVGCRAHTLVLIVGRHPHIDDRKIRLVLGDDGQQGLGIADPRDDLVPGILEQSREPLPEQDGVFGDHDSHGISASIRVPTPGGLWMRSVPPWAWTRSARPRRPVPFATVAPPLPSSATTSLSSPCATDASTRTRDGAACLTAFVTASQTMK